MIVTKTTLFDNPQTAQKRKKGTGMKDADTRTRVEIEREIKEKLNKLTYRQLIHILSIIPDKSQEAGN